MNVYERIFNIVNLLKEVETGISKNNKGITKKRLFNEWVYKEAKNSETDKRRKNVAGGHQ